VILYILVAGYPPFYGNTDNEILIKVRDVIFDFEGDEWANVSGHVKNLISRMLVKDIGDRATIDEVLEHTWLTMNREQVPDTQLNVSGLRDFAASSQFRKSVLMVIANQCAETDIARLREKFNEIDANSDGSITFNEFQDTLQ
jgi:calcium-dependent protein kinase